MFTQDVLQQCYPQTPASVVELYFPPLVDTFDKNEINTNLRIAAFLATIGIESNYLRVIVENLNYSQQGLRTVFGRYFPDDKKAAQYAHNSEAIASLVYANRMGNGPEGSQEGWNYRGRGLIQITGKDNYKACSQALGVDFVTNPDLLLQPQYAVAATGWFWASRDLNTLADTQDFKKVCLRVNGGLIGFQERSDLYSNILGILGNL